MIPIRALVAKYVRRDSDDDDVGSSSDDEEYVDLEGVLSDEYHRAMRLYREGQKEEALKLFTEILDADMLQEVRREESPRAYKIKYSCMKQLGFLYDALGDQSEAISYWLMACDLDSQDVFMLNRLGRVASNMGYFHVGGYAFNEILKQNPNHYEAGDGLLQCLFSEQNYLEAYGWAMHMLEQQPNYVRGHSVIQSIQKIFHNNMAFIQSCFSKRHTSHAASKCATMPVASMATIASPPEPQPSLPPLKLGPWKIEELSWLSIADCLIKYHKHNEAFNFEAALNFKFGEIVDLVVLDKNGNEIVSCEMPPSKKPRTTVRRRSLMQVSRVPLNEALPSSTPLNMNTLSGQLTKIIFDGMPNSCNRTQSIDLNENASESFFVQQNRPAIDKAEFQSATQAQFEYFHHRLGVISRPFTRMMLLWLEAIEVNCSETIPGNILQKFMIIYELYIDYTDFDSEKIVGCEHFEPLLRLTIFYLELRFDQLIENVKQGNAVDAARESTLLAKLLWMPWASKYIEPEELLYERLLRLQYCMARYVAQDFHQAIDILECLKEHLTNRMQLNLVNLKHDNVIDPERIDKFIEYNQLRLRLTHVNDLLANNEFAEVKSILIATLSRSVCAEELPFCRQFELLLEILKDRVEDEPLIIQWGAHFLRFAVTQWMTTQKRAKRMKIVWTDKITSALCYIGGVLNNDSEPSHANVFREYAVTLFSSLIELLVLQIDENPVLLQKLQLFKMIHRLLISISPTIDQQPNDDTMQCVVPASLLICDAIHKHLAKNNRCSQNECAILVQLFDVSYQWYKRHGQTDRPVNDAVRHSINQLADCLFGIDYCGALHPSQRPLADQLNSSRRWQLMHLCVPDNIRDKQRYDASSNISESVFSVAKTMIADIVETDQIILEQRIAKLKYGLSLHAQNPYHVAAVHPMTFYVVGRYFLCIMHAYKLAAEMFLYDMAMNMPHYNSWLALGVSYIRLIEADYNGNSPSKMRLTERDQIADIIMLCGNKCLEIDRKDQAALKLFGQFAYNYHVWTHARSTPHRTRNSWLTKAHKFIEHMDEDWFTLFMKAKILEKISRHDALSFYDRSLKHLWKLSPQVPSRFSHHTANVMDVRKIEVFYRMVLCISRNDDGDFSEPSPSSIISHLKGNCLLFESQTPIFNVAAHSWTSKRIIQHYLQFCASINSSHKMAVYSLAKIHFAGMRDGSNDNAVHDLILGTYQTGSMGKIKGLFNLDDDTDLFETFVPSPCADINQLGSFTRCTARCVELLIEYLEKCHNYKSLLKVAVYLKNNSDHIIPKYLNVADHERLVQQALEAIADIAFTLFDGMSELDASAAKALALMTDLLPLHTEFDANATDTQTALIQQVFHKGYCVHETILSPIENGLTDEEGYQMALRMCCNAPLNRACSNENAQTQK